MNKTVKQPLTYFREANMSDFEDIFNLYISYNSIINKESVDSCKEYYFKLFSEKTAIHNFWVIVNNIEKIVGYGSLIKSSNNFFRVGVCAELSVYIGEDNINKGLGIKLTEFIIKNAINSQLELIFAYISIKNKSSIRAAKHLDFQEIGKIPPYESHGKTFTNTLLIKQLTKS